MKIYAVTGKENYYFSTLRKAQTYVLSLGEIEKVKVDRKVYCKKKTVYANDYTEYEFYDCLESKTSYTQFLLSNDCLNCDTKIYFGNACVTIKEIEVE